MELVNLAVFCKDRSFFFNERKLNQYNPRNFKKYILQPCFAFPFQISLLAFQGAHFFSKGGIAQRSAIKEQISQCASESSPNQILGFKSKLYKAQIHECLSNDISHRESALQAAKPRNDA